MRCITALLLLVAIGAVSARAEDVTFEGLTFKTPANMTRNDGGPRPPAPFLRFNNGERSDPLFEGLEVISAPIEALEGRLSPNNFAEFALTPANRFCGRHEVLRNSSREAGVARIVDVGYVCYEHSRQPQYSRQVVRAVGVFYDGKFTSFMFARMWLDAEHPDDRLTPEQWMQPTDELANSITPDSASN